MRMRAPATLLLALVLGAACAVLVGCGSKANPHLVSQARAQNIGRDLDDLRSAVDAGDCQAASEAARRLQDDVSTLPRTTDPRLAARLQEGALNLRIRAAKECRQAQTTPTTTTETQTQTVPTETTQTETTTTETTPATTETTPTTTSTTPTTTTTTPDSGGSTVPPP
jgi:cell division septation protein DedD